MRTVPVNIVEKLKNSRPLTKHFVTYSLVFGLALVLGLAWYLTPDEVPPQTWHESDKRAFGGYVLHEYLADYSNQEVSSIYVPANEYVSSAEDSLANYFLVSESLQLSAEDWYQLESQIEAGATVIMASHNFPYFLNQYLNFSEDGVAFRNMRSNIEDLLISKRKLFYAPEINFPSDSFPIPKSAADVHFNLEVNPADSSLVPLVLAYNHFEVPVLLHYSIGDGQLITSSTPSLFNNFLLMDSASAKFAQGIFSFLRPDLPVRHFEFYKLGRLESESPLRVALKVPNLKIAIYLALGLGFIYLLLGGKRRQKAVPPKKVWNNDNLDFLEKLSYLYHRNGHHRNLLLKRMQYFQEYLEKNYRIRLRPEQPEVFEELIRKLEPEPSLIGPIRMAYVKAHNEKVKVSAQDLLDAEKALQTFYQVYKHGRKH